MLLMIALTLTATIALAALEIWLFWRIGDRDARRRRRERQQTSRPPDEDTAPASARPTMTAG